MPSRRLNVYTTEDDFEIKLIGDEVIDIEYVIFRYSASNLPRYIDIADEDIRYVLEGTLMFKEDHGGPVEDMRLHINKDGEELEFEVAESIEESDRSLLFVGKADHTVIERVKEYMKMWDPREEE